MTGACQRPTRHSNDSLLTALAQNGALRLQCDRALVSLIEDGTSWVVAGAGQSSLLCAPYDQSTSSYRILQQALLDRIQSAAVFGGRRLANQSDNVIADHTRHIILDLQQNQDSNEPVLTRVSYAAVPIKSVSGQLLGMYTVIDSKTRQDFMTNETYIVLSDIACATAQHLGTQDTRMNMNDDTRAKLNFSKFLEHNRPRPTRTVEAGRHLPTFSDTSKEINRGTSSPTSSSSSNSTLKDALDETVLSANSTPLTTPAEECSEFVFVDPSPTPTLLPCRVRQSSDAKSTHTLTSQGSRRSDPTLSIAASLIRAAHDLEGLVLLDITNTGDDTTSDHVPICETLEASIVDDDSTPARITHSIFVEHESLDYLISKFPQGCVLRVSEEEISALVVMEMSSPGPAVYEILDKMFVMPPDLHLLLQQAQSLVFMPLWDPTRRTTYASMLGWPRDPVRVFKEHDLLSLSIYGRVLCAEITRLNALDTEATKSDFVSSLSHELRSPLHGCLGAVEVLRDTALDKSQIELLGMIDSCASTLLFTMNHLLDFSKINDLDRTRSRHRGDSHGETSLASPRNTFGQVSEDYLCRIVQGVVEGVWYGHDREQAAHERGSNAFLQDQDLHLDSDSPIVKNKDVAIFLFMESHAAWFSMVSAGAWKRLVMNLFGNSLKFCQRGYIEVTLKMVPDPKNPGKKMAHLMVSDTGIGMSENFMKHALYRPFMQENSLVSGTGVGLNIVKQIVNDLQGTINVTSTLGIGTRFDVFIPLVERKSISDEAIPDGGEILDPEAVLSGRTLCLLPSSHTTSGSTDTPLERTTMVHSYVKSIAENWFQMKVISAETADEVDADIYVTEVSDYASHSRSTGKSSDMANRHRTILVGNQREISQTQQQYSNDFVDLKYPLGPRSLSLALHTAMKTRINQATQVLTDPATASSPEQIEEIVEIKAVSHEMENVPGQPTHLTKTEHLLLVDDNAINLKILSTFVRKLSFDARTAIDGEDALETYTQFSKTQPFTTILMDISMPKMNGFESSRAIRQFEVENSLPPSRIIALTALGSEASRREAEASGIDEFQTKPVALRTLKELLQSAS